MTSDARQVRAHHEGRLSSGTSSYVPWRVSEVVDLLGTPYCPLRDVLHERLFVRRVVAVVHLDAKQPLQMGGTCAPRQTGIVSEYDTTLRARVEQVIGQSTVVDRAEREYRVHAAREIDLARAEL
eukprot:911253-Prymnesium_polylepis.1